MLRTAILTAVLAVLPVVAQAHQVTIDVAGQNYTFEIMPEVEEGYDRDDWSHWDSNLRDGCFNVRDKVLTEESYRPIVTVPASGERCRVTEGLWHDPYTGQSFTNSSDVQIDHVVPLFEAHRSGGHAWDDQTRREYANYLGYAHHLIAVEGNENGVVKKDRDPAEYVPIDEFQCQYVVIWIEIKNTWDLNMDQAEADAIQAVLADC